MSFVGLHIHSDYSLLDGASQLPQMIDRAVELGMPAIALTDHGVMYGAIELIKVCRNKNVKPIIGNEMYVINGDIEKQERRPKYHQVVLAKNTQGYKNLVKLTTISHLKGFQGKGIFARPCINKDVLEKHKEGLIVTSACLGGEIPQAILKGKLEAAEKVANWYKTTFGDDFYIEIQDHGQQEDRIVNVELVKIARKLDIKIIATNDSHFISCYDVEAHDALLCIQTNKLITEDKRLRYTGTEYLKSAEEMAKLFRDHLSDDVIQEAISTTLEVAEKVEPYNIMGEYRIPNFPIPPEHTADTYVEDKTWEGLRERLKVKNNSEINSEYRERLEYELKMIQRMGFSTYFLVVWDYIRFARENNIPVGPGRGSAAGSLVAYALKITNIDPVHHGLLFERFLNPERKSMPDIDTDFCIERRDEVIKYVTEKYGEDRVAQIITFNRMTSKAVLKDVARVLGIPYAESDRMAKLIPVARGKPEKLKVMISDETPDPEFKKTYETSVYDLEETGTQVTARQWLDMAIRIEGTNKTYGVHAAGVVISSDPLDEIVPLQKNNDGAVITQYFMEDLDSLGLLKMDFLGLKNLTMIQRTIELINKTQKLKLDPDDFPLNERKIQHILAKGNIKKVPGDIENTYKVLEQGDLEGIFQLESSGMRQVVRDLKPSCIEDISSILALYRPGPLDAGLIPKFIDRKHGREDIIYEHSLLEPILKETYAVLVYQEQIMKVAQDLAGYTLGQADLLRRAMGKKKLSEMQKHRETFIDGATKNGIPQKVAENLFEQMVKFAEYCFNKSHSTAYGYVTYQTAYLKANFPLEYMSALLTSNSGDQDKLKKYLVNCANLGIEVDPPDINRSDVEFTPAEGKILFGLSAIKNLGEGAIEHILEARKTGGPFKSLADLCDRVDLRAVNSRALEALIKCGAFDKLNPNRHQLLEDVKLIVSWAQDRAKDRDIGQGNLLDLLGNATATQPAKQSFEMAPSAKPVPDFPQKEKLQFEKELLGLYVSAHPLKFAQRVSGQLDPPGISLNQMEEKKGKKVSTIVMLTEIKKITTKKDNRLMAFLKLEDLEGQSEAVVFPDTYEKIKDLLVEETPLILSGKVENRNDQLQLIVDEAQPIKEELENTIIKPATPTELVSMLMLELTAQQVTDEKQLKHLKTILEEYTGATNSNKLQVVAKIMLGNEYKCVRFGEGFWVQDHQAAVDRLNHDGFVASIAPHALLK